MLHDDIFNKKGNFFQSPSAYKKKIQEEKRVREFKKMIVIDFFELYDGCTRLERKIKVTPAIESDDISPCTIVFSILMLASGILGILSYFTHGNPVYYPNNEISGKRVRETCGLRHSHGASIFSYVPTTYTCWTEVRNEPNLSYFEFLTVVALFLAAIGLMVCELREESLTISDVVNELNKFINLLQSLDEESKKIIFEDFDSVKTLDNLKMLLEEMKIPHIQSIDVNKIIPALRAEVSKIKQHLSSQDNEGYFSNFLPSEAIKMRQEQNKYVNVVNESQSELRRIPT